MRIPKNKILENQYTSGGEFIYSLNNNEYIGYYYIIGGTQYYAGKVYDKGAYRLFKIEDVAPNGPTTKNIATNLNRLISTDALISRQFKLSQEDIENGYLDRYFIKKKNSNPIEIKEVGQETFVNFKNKPLYQGVQVRILLNSSNDEVLNNAYKEMEGLKEFLSV